MQAVKFVHGLGNEVREMTNKQTTNSDNVVSKLTSARLRRAAARNNRGSLIAEGAAGMVFITIGVVCCVLLLINAGLSFYYKEKLGFVCDQSARYAASRSESSRDSETKAYVEEVVKAIGLPADQLAVQIKESEICGAKHIGVHIEANFGLISDGRVIPGFLRLSDDSLVNTQSGGAGEIKGYALIQQASQDDFIAVPVAYTGRSGSAIGSMMGKYPKSSKPLYQLFTDSANGQAIGGANSKQSAFGTKTVTADLMSWDNKQGAEHRDTLN